MAFAFLLVDGHILTDSPASKRLGIDLRLLSRSRESRQVKNCVKDLRGWAHIRTFARWTLVFYVCVLLAGCNRGSTASTPQIVFSKVPVADVGGPETMDTIEGRVTGVRANQRIVLYAKGENRWWVQPLVETPFTNIQGDSTWKNKTHLGTDYAALLVNPGYEPPSSPEELPAQGGLVAAVALVQGRGSDSPPTKILHFSGYDWVVRTAPSLRGGVRNIFSSANAWVDDAGALHLRITKDHDRWSCAEVQTTRDLGYGTYAFVVRDISRLESSAVLTLFTWDGAGPEQNRRELAFEISRWGSPHEDHNIGFVVQPYYIPTNVVRFHAPGGLLTNTFRWEPSEVTFTTYAGSHVAGGVPPVNQHVFTSGIPTPDGHAARINLYIFEKGEVPLQRENEIVIEKFAYYP
jgi:hypothetical protein